ncbi:MAG: Asp-tRNA(Asn)/Glu-tRNA(Gln) amidotransferase subunit GatC [Myxococcota bacterium]
MAHIDREEVIRVAALARLSVSAEEADRLARDLDRILEYVETLDAVDTTNVEPMSHVIPIETPMREDLAVAAIDPELALANAPERHGFAFVVPKVLADEDPG